MHLVQAAILGLIQGLTEFLPVSSSAHLILVRDVLHWNLLGDDPHWNTIFDLSVHAGTFAALLVYFRQDVARLLDAFFTSFRRGLGGVPERRLAWIILIATIPAAVAGVSAESVIEANLRQAPSIVASLLVIFGLALWLAERVGRKLRETRQIGWVDGIIIGLFQALALAPGVSRSGITMTAGLARGLTRETAARFSFLLSLPVIGGAALFGLHEAAQNAASLPPGSTPIFTVGFFSAGISGYLCIRYFLAYLQRRSLAPFIVYRVALGVLLLVWFALGW